MKKKAKWVCPEGHVLKKEPNLIYIKGITAWICPKCSHKNNTVAWAVGKWITGSDALVY